ncbi:MAG TPA: FN3 associated domain-containing protein [Dongiaceae bacterium]|nr:FN3 associated domain-containing protein [Dongiaceae bacterium]
MKTAPSLLRLRKLPRRLGLRRVCATAILALLATLLLPNSQATTVKTITGGPTQNNPNSYFGYADGAIVGYAQFHTPYGLAIDSSGKYLFIADRDNDAIRMIDFNSGFAFTAIPNESTPTNIIHKPIAVVLDEPAGNMFVLNRGNGTNGTLLQFDTLYGELLATNATGLVNAAGMALDGSGTIYLTVQSNTVIRLLPPYTNSTVVATVTEANASLQGIAVMHSGMIATCDSSRNGIYNIDPATGIVTTNAGFHGVGDFPTNSLNFQSPTLAKFNQPYGVAVAGDDSLIVTDKGNERVKVVLPTGAVSNLYGVNKVFWYENTNATPVYLSGWADGTVVVPDYLVGVAARQPVGVVFSPDGAVYVTEDYYHIIRKITDTGLVLPPPPPPPAPAAPANLTATADYGKVSLAWSAVSSATNYIVRRSQESGGPYTLINTTTGTSYTDFTVMNGTTYYYVVAAANAGGAGLNSSEVSITPPLPPVADPQIGYVDFPASANPTYTSVFHETASFDFYNDAILIIKGTPGSGTFYTFADTYEPTNVPMPTTNSASIPSDYVDGKLFGQVTAYTVAHIAPYLTIKAMGAKSDGSPDSAVVIGRYQFKTGNPVINGNNAARFTLSDITDNAHLYYTLDGTDPSPTNGADLGVVGTATNVWNVGFTIISNTVFKVRAFRDNFQPSAVVSNLFSATNFVANRISFGFESGEGSSDFVAAPGQYFYAPVTLSLLPGATMFSLQYNLTVTNNPGNPVPLMPGSMSFRSMLMKPIPNTAPPVYEPIPPAMFVAGATVPNPVLLDGSYNFSSLMFLNTNINLLAVGWVERATKTNLYNTLNQDLVTYSIAHDTLHTSSSGKVIVGGFGFTIPTNAAANSTYRIQIARPSATSDGIGAPGADVFIDAPTNGSLGAGPINSIKNVTIGIRKYIVGDVYPFRWFNAGDFGQSNLVSADVVQVFQSAVYGLNEPIYDPNSTNTILGGYTNVSDLYDAMDSCGAIGANDGTGTYTNATPYPSGSLTNLFGGTDTNINQVAFGDGVLNVCDVYVTYRRSLDPSLTWYRRFWSQGRRVADIVPNVAPHLISKTTTSSLTTRIQTKATIDGLTTPPSVVFTAGDALASAGGQTLTIPISARVYGDYPLTVVMLNLTVTPLDGAPAITVPVQFFPSGAFGTPYTTSSDSPANYSGVWLNPAVTGIASNGVIGNLQITLPAGATANAAYAVHFDHVSGSPNGLASFPASAVTGLLTLGDRSASSWGDGIPDSWRLRNFGTIYNQLSAAHADADGDNSDNLTEYLAGTNPNDSASVLRLRSPDSQSPHYSVRWPSVVGKQYVIERSASLFGADWQSISTNAGTGVDIEFTDTNVVSGNFFYRVRVAQ